MTPDIQTAERLTRIEANIERIAALAERLADDHENRIRVIEQFQARILGVLAVVSFFGAGSTAGIVAYLATRAG